jgi:hypothetical protein
MARDAETRKRCGKVSALKLFAGREIVQEDAID